MKQRILSLLVLLVAAVTGAWAQEPVPEYTLDKGTRQNCDIAFKVGAQDRTRANEGETVTITVTPNSGYATKNITVTAYMETGQMRVARRAPGDGGGAPASEIVEDIEVTPVNGNPNAFTITMPKANVIVDAYTTRILQSNWIYFQNNQQLTYTGQEQEPGISVGFWSGNRWTTLRPSTDYTVEYTNNVNAGTATVTITAVPGSDYSDPDPKASRTFTINTRRLANNMIAAIDAVTYTGSAFTPEPTVTYNGMTLVKGTDFNYSYSSNVNAGTATVTITAVADGNYTGSARRTYTIQKKALEDEMIQAIVPVTYSGVAQRPTPTVKYGSLTLDANTDYTVSYSDNENAGTATVTVTARPTSQNYSGSAKRTFIINKKALTVTADNKQVTYGDPAPTYTESYDGFVNNETKAVLGGTLNLACSYVQNTSGVGTYDITPSGLTSNNYAITFTKGTLTVVKKALEEGFIAPIAAQTYTGSQLRPAPVLTFNGMTLAVNTDYTVSYSSNTNVGTATVTITGKGNYSGTVTTNFTINPKALEDSFVATIAAQTYTGYLLQPAPVVTYNGMTLRANTDYTVSYSNNTNVGIATVTITGKGNYSGTVTTNFSINARPATYLMIEPITPRTYSGYVIKPLITVRDGAKVLERNVDYTASYENFLNAGTATVTVTGIGNYRGSVSRTYTIKRKPLADEMIEAIADQTYTGEAIEPEITVKDEEIVLEGVVMTLVEGTDYTVAYSDNVNGGTATVTITGIGNFTGTATAEFTINPRTTVDGNITVEEDGEEVALTINDAGTQQGKTVEEDLEVTTLNYYRTLKTSDVNAYTICLPYAPPKDPNLKYYTLTSVDGTALHFDEIEGEPQAFTPYLVMASADVDISKEGYKETFTMSKEVANTSVAGSYVMKGTLSGIQHDDAVGLYIMQAGNRWAKVGSNTKAYIPPFRAYIEVTSAVPERLDSTIGGENSATEITSVCATDEDGTEHWFDLSGHPIEKPTKSGIYIHNGRKEYVK